MEITDKALKKMSEIINIKGFYITSKGDPSVGISDALWELQHDFYFDNQEELEVFRKHLADIFEDYCGPVKVETFEEVSKMIGEEDDAYYAQFPVRYLVQDKGYSFDTFKKAGSCASYSKNVGEAIHFELPDYIPENGDSNTTVIKSTDPEFKEILLKAAGELENEIHNEEYRLSIARRNLNLIKRELKYCK